MILFLFSEKLESVFSELKGLHKRKLRSGEANKNQERKFVPRLDYLFDVVHVYAFDPIAIPEEGVPYNPRKKLGIADARRSVSAPFLKLKLQFCTPGFTPANLDNSVE
jgi:hypothetical protein